MNSFLPLGRHDLSSLSHLTHENPDEPEASCENRHQTVANKFPKTITPFFYNNQHIHLQTLRKNKIGRGWYRVSVSTLALRWKYPSHYSPCLLCELLLHELVVCPDRKPHSCQKTKIETKNKPAFLTHVSHFPILIDLRSHHVYHDCP